MRMVKKAISILKLPMSPSAYLILQCAFYLCAFAYYLERQLNFQFYYSSILVTEFHSDMVQPLVASPSYWLVLQSLWFLHLIFLLGLFAAAFNRKHAWMNIFLYGFNFILLLFNYVSGYAADIFIQLGLFFFIFGSLGRKKLEKDPYVLASLLLLRFYLGAGYILSSGHKIVDYVQTGSTFLTKFALIQHRNLVADSLVIGDTVLNTFQWPLFALILAAQLLGGLALMFRRTSRAGQVILVLFHLISIPLLNLLLFPLISITLISLSCISENYSIQQIWQMLKEDSGKFDREVSVEAEPA